MFPQFPSRFLSRRRRHESLNQFPIRIIIKYHTVMRRVEIVKCVIGGNWNERYESFERDLGSI